MSTPSSNVTSPSTSSLYASSMLGTGMGRSASNRSLFRDLLPSTSSALGRVKNRSRTNTIGEGGWGDDHMRNLGSDYQEIQKRTLTKWVNAQLSQVDDRITNIDTDLKDGKRLLKLLGVVAKEPAPKPERMNMRIHQLSNVAQALSFLEKQVGSEAMPDIGNEAIVNGDVKKTLALIFFIMLKYQIQLIITEHGEDFIASLSSLSQRSQLPPKDASSSSPPPPLALDTPLQPPATPIPTNQPGSALIAARKIGGSSNSIAEKSYSATDAKLALLYWVRIQLEDYIVANIIPSIQDFSRSWRTGLAFCLLVHRHDPVLIPDLFTIHLKANLSEKQTWHTLLTLAFDLASAHLGIPPYLEPEELIDVDYPHEPSVMMYVSEYYKVMSRSQREEPEEVKRKKTIQRRATIATVTGGEEEEEDEDEGDNIHLPMPMTDDEHKTTSTESPSVLSLSPTASPSPEPLIMPHEPPLPVPTPSARRKKMAHRRSTLGEDEKARIKADLTDRLMMQLTGHLPRGVHPVLDQLITIHETVLSFIKTNVRTIDEIPEEFTDSTAVAEYIDALEIIEDQMEVEAQHLETAKQTRRILTSPPETADDRLIRLTELQRSQVVKLHDVLQSEWNEFVTLLHATKTDLIRVENDLTGSESDRKTFESEAQAIEQKLQALYQLLSNTAPKENDQPIHPLDGSEKVVQIYQENLSQAADQLNSFELNAWKAFKRAILQLSPSVLRSMSTRHDQIQNRYTQLATTLNEAKKDCINFQRGLEFQSRVTEVDRELQGIQSVMDSNQKATTNNAISELEKRVSFVRSKINAIREEFGDLWVDDDKPHSARFQACFEKIEHQYQTVRSWVDEVRVWFVEAQRIRKWIDARIETIQERNEKDAFDPLAVDFSLTQDEATQLEEEHQRLKKRIDRFNADDMARLRAHVKKLTMSERDRELSPADTSTIEITLVTLNMLNKLMQLLQDRSMTVDMVNLRLKWEAALAHADAWIGTTDGRITEFIQGQARWTDDDTSDGKNRVRRSHEHTEQVIQALVELEEQIARFDQGDYLETLDGYQEMEDLHGDSLPEYLDGRQVHLEQRFADLMKRSVFARKVVEQHLTVQDVVTQFKQMMRDGERLRQDMMEAVDVAGYAQEKDVFGDTVRQFKDNSAHLLSNVDARVYYPEESVVTEADAEANLLANDRIRETLQTYGTALAILAEDLEDLLTSHRQSMSLQQRATFTYDEVLRVASWMDERTNALYGSRIDEAELEEEVIVQCKKDTEAVAARLAQMEQTEMVKLMERVRRVEDEIDASNAVSIDRQTFIDGIELLETNHERLKQALLDREQELEAQNERLIWESHSADVQHRILDTTQEVWQVIANATQRPHENETVFTMAQDVDHLKTTCHDLSADIQKLDEQLEMNKTRYEDLKQISNEGVQFMLVKRKDVQQTQEQLDRLVHLATSLLGQRQVVTSLFSDAQTVEAQGHAILDMIAADLGQGTTDVREQFVAFEQQIDRLCNLQLDLPKDSDWMAVDQLSEISENLAEMKSTMDEKQASLASFKAKITRCVRDRETVHEMSSMVRQQEQETERLRRLLEEHSQSMKQPAIDVTQEHFSVDVDTLALTVGAHSKLAAEVAHLEKTEIQALQVNLEELSHRVTERDQLSVDLATVKRGVSEVTSRLGQLKQSLTDRDKLLDAAQQRAQWESLCKEASMQLEAMHEQVRQLVSVKNKCIGQADVPKTTLQTMAADLEQLENGRIALMDHTMPQVHEAYTHFGEALLKTNTLSAVPGCVEARWLAVQRSAAKLKEIIAETEKETESLQRRLHWTNAVQTALKELAEKQSNVVAFVEERARWNPDIDHEACDEQALQQASEDLAQDFTEFQNKTVAPLVTKFQQLQVTSAEHSTSFVMDTLSGLWDELQHIQEQVKNDLTFAEEVVKQRCFISDFVWQTTQLEQVAESIREEFLAAETDLQRPIERFQKFRADVVDIQQRMGAPIPLPSRSKHYALDNGVKDSTLNAVVQNTMQMRCARLTELCMALQGLVDSKEKASRCKMAVDGYEKQAKLCVSWIKQYRNRMEEHRELIDHTATADLYRLKEALSSIDSLETSMKAKENIYSLLVTVYERCMQLLADEQEGDLKESREHVVQTQSTIGMDWQRLLDQISHASSILAAALVPAEFSHQLHALMGSFEQLKSDVDKADPMTVTDETMLQWQKRIDHLANKDYANLLRQSANCAEKLSAETSSQLDDVSEMVLCIRTLLTELYDTVDLHRLCKTHEENAAIVIKMISRASEAVDDVMRAYRQASTAEKPSKEQRDTRQQHLLTSQRQIRKQLAECEEAYDDLVAYYQFIITQGGQEIVLQTHQQVENAWSTVQQSMSHLSLFISYADKWVKAYEKLERIYEQLTTLKSQLDTDNASPDAMEAQLPAIESGLDGLAEMLHTIEEDQTNHQADFAQHHAAVTARYKAVQSQLSSLRLKSERVALMRSFSIKTKQLRAVCEDQLTFIKQQAASNPNIVGKQADAINNIVHAYGEALNHIRETYTECKSEYDGLIKKQADRLIDTLDQPRAEVDDAKRPLEEVLANLDQAIQSADAYVTALKSASQYARMEVDSARSLTDFKAFLSQCSKSATTRANNKHPIPDLKDFISRYNSITESMREFFEMGNELKSKLQEEKKMNSARIMSITKSVDQRQKGMRRRWSESRAAAEETKGRLEELQRRQDAAAKISSIHKYVDSISHRLKSLQLSGRTIALEEEELKEIEQEVEVSLTSRTRALDTLLSQLNDNDGALKRQRAQLTISIDDLRDFLVVRRQQAYTQGNITLFLNLADQLQEHMAELSMAIRQAAPQNAQIVNNRFNKSNLQTMLKTLVTTYKSSETTIVDLLEQAKSEAKKQFLDDNDRVAARLDQIVRQWTETQAAATAREKELLICINQLNHEFFTKLAMARSTPRMRAERRPAATRPPSVAGQGARRSSFKSSTLSVDNRIAATQRRSRSPVPSNSKQRTKYVADPKNELDIQLGLIVNENSYGVKVKRVSGESGKYWFGEEHPRLVYCRILPSKLVMVRVGGGWVELSKFLKDHSHNETGMMRRGSIASDSDGYQETFLSVKNNLSSSRLSVQDNGSVMASSDVELEPSVSSISSTGRSRSSAVSSSTGYVDGDRYIQMDEDGNQIAFKMTKAKDDAKMPVITKSRS
ncbi:uncharacterized protein BYT42DRAFT_616709 [Radiomyces spectabilis]|uniref:uncharacterized protein n=1 Tax=Radiomyces spectabilis TaxID=64574 RepID=UPI00221F7F73|nr:uncharacterized protein BYT42DRAFT_616709 [Radiomyces spectabilis]KAI8371633.1 hypothetical protein BYT42DRAFT_616709 [Radiomyces spectabilis]